MYGSPLARFIRDFPNFILKILQTEMFVHPRKISRLSCWP